jgi:hypothetical protein
MFKPESQSPDIHVRWPYDTQVIAEIDDGGYVHAEYGNNGVMYVTDLYVPPEGRQQGQATALLTTMRDVLVARGGKCMVADITTRPCADTMRSVLGAEAVQSVLEGDYQPDDPEYVPPAIARLNYQVDQPQQPAAPNTTAFASFE